MDGNTNPAEMGRAKMTIPSHLESSASEVLIRTMKSDLERLGKSGGVAGAGFSRATVTTTQEAPVVSSARKTNPLLWIVIVAAALGLFLIGFFLPSLIKTKPTSTSSRGVSGNTTPSVAGSVSQTSGVGSGTAPPASELSHQSFFVTPAEETLVVHLSSLDPTPLSLQLQNFFSGLSAQATLFELVIDDDNVLLGWNAFLGVLGVDLLLPNIWSDHFQNDFTAFVYHENKNYWPGYILKLKDKELSLVVQPQILKMENNPAALAKLFLKDQGVIVGDFSDGQIAGQPVRMAHVGTKGATLSYGFFYGKYLIISTSDVGLAQALKNL